MKHLDMLNYTLCYVMSQKTRIISVSAVKTSNLVTKCWIVGKCVQVLCEAGWVVCDSIINAASKESLSQLNCCKLSVLTEHGVILNLP